ncbi:MAG: hypothetical protein FWE88_03160 [Phycisphaerae bacterium]|nr:hypothetical protein [Phycisphaerae bacterium]
MTRTILLALVMCGVFSAVAYGASQTIILKDGRKIAGDVTRTDSGYRVKTENGEMLYKTTEVDRVVDHAAFEKEYKDRLAKIGDKDADAHLELAKWAEQNGQLKIAQTELKRCLTLAKDHEEARMRLRRIEAALAPPAEPATKPATTASSNKSTSSGASGGIDVKDLITDEDINKIRFADLRPSDTGMSIEFKNQALNNFIKAEQGQRGLESKEEIDRFRKLSNVRQVIFIRETPGYGGVKDDIIIKSDPKFMKDFRTIWPTIDQNCASINCHGGAKGKGELKLFPKGNAKNDRIDYTNYLILNLWEKDGKRLFDRDRPEDSLVLQYGLPHANARYKHPELTPQMKVIFANKNVTNYKKLAQFIRELEAVRSPEAMYDTKYQPPVGRKLGSDDSRFDSTEEDDDVSTEPEE